MHAGYLGLLKTHCREIFQIDVTAEGGDGTAVKSKKPVPRPTPEIMDYWLNVIEANAPGLQRYLSAHKDCRHGILWHICVEHGLRHIGTKWQLAGNISVWVSRQTC